MLARCANVAYRLAAGHTEDSERPPHKRFSRQIEVAGERKREIQVHTPGVDRPECRKTVDQAEILTPAEMAAQSDCVVAIARLVRPRETTFQCRHSPALADSRLPGCGERGDRIIAHIGIERRYLPEPMRLIFGAARKFTAELGQPDPSDCPIPKTPGSHRLHSWSGSMAKRSTNPAPPRMRRAVSVS
jgi:hypothetical protein